LKKYCFELFIFSWWRWSFDAKRTKTIEAGTKLLLSGIAQVFYGDESARSLVVEGTQGDATLRSFMNWDAIKKILRQKTLSHWRKLGQNHPAIGAGIHKEISAQPYTFSRTYSKSYRSGLHWIRFAYWQKSTGRVRCICRRNAS
jgi:hypothetical protein